MTLRQLTISKRSSGERQEYVKNGLYGGYRSIKKLLTLGRNSIEQTSGLFFSHKHQRNTRLAGVFGDPFITVKFFVVDFADAGICDKLKAG